MEKDCKDIIERFAKLEERVALKFEAEERAINVAHKEMERRLQGMNEFQKRMDKLEGTFVTREILDTKFDKIEPRIASLQRIIYVAIGGLLAIQFLVQFL